MPELPRTPISISIFKPQVIADSLEGCWFAVVSDGAVQVEVTEWPLWDCQFLVDADTVLRFELYTADDQSQFWRNECNKFSEVYVPAAKVIRGHGGVFRCWLGLQRGFFMDEVSLPSAMERYEVSLTLAKCLLTPKLCISVLTANVAMLEGPSTTKDGSPERCKGAESDAMLRQSVTQHSNIITALNQQMYTLWLKGRIVSGDKSTNDKFTAYLLDANVEDSSPFAGVFDYEKLADADSVSRLQDEVSRLTESMVTASSRLEESEKLKIRYREQLTELTGEQFEEDDCASLDEADFASIQALQREARHLQEKLQVERARSTAAQKDLEALRSGSAVAVKWTDSKADELKRRHSDELRQLNRIHAAEVESFRAAEHEQRLSVQEMQRKSDSLAQEALRKQAQVTVLHDEIGELTARLAEAWNTQAQSPDVFAEDRPLAHHALSFAELEASRREVEELRQQLLSAEGASALRSNGIIPDAPLAINGSHGHAIERAQSVLREFQKDAASPLSDRERVLCSEVDRLACFAVELQKEREGARIACEDLCRRRDIAERRAVDLQREVDQAAGEAMLTASTILDKESQELVLRQEVRSLSSKFLELQESLSGGASPEASANLNGTQQKSGKQVVQEAFLRESSESARVEVESLKAVLKTRTLEHKEEVSGLRTHLQKERQALREQADAHAETLRQRDAQHARQLGAVYSELSLENQARRETEKRMGEAQQVEFSRCEQAAHVAARDREDRLRCELQDLEDANMVMSQQTQRQFDDFACLQERFSKEILSFRKEQAMLEDGPSGLARLQQSHRTLQSEVRELRSELSAERKRWVDEASPPSPMRRHGSSTSTMASGCDTPIRRKPVEGVWGVEPVFAGTLAISASASSHRAVTSHVAQGHQIKAVQIKAVGAVPRASKIGERRKR